MEIRSASFFDNVAQSFVVALGMLRLHKMRAFLTMLGVIIGVMSVTIIVMLSNGFKSYLSKEFSKIGSDTIFVYFDPGKLERGESMGNLEQLKLDDVKYISEKCDKVGQICAYRQVGSPKVQFESKEVNGVNTRGVDPGFFDLNKVELLSGRYFTEADSVARANVCIIGKKVAEELFPGADSATKALGKFIMAGDLTMEVIGVSEKLELMGDSKPEVMFVPLSTANSKWVGGDSVDLILMKPKPGIKVADTLEQVWQALMRKTNNKVLYGVESSENVLKVFTGVIGGAGMVLAGIAALSLLVGGIGIMNIMLVSVTERTKEIGLRKAIGAKRFAIQAQFLIEAGTLSLIGGLIGMGIAYLMGLGVTALSAASEFPNKGGLETPFPLSAALMASAFSALIGMLFGFFPAVTAAKLDPIVALRAE